MTAFPYKLTGPIGTRAVLGLIVLQADETIEHDFRRLLPTDGVSLNVSRVPSGREVTGVSLAEMSRTLPAAAGLFPDPLTYDVVGYGCTSGTAVIGADRVAELIRSGCNTKEVTEPVSALVAACHHLGMRRLAFLSPYIAEVSETLREALRNQNVDTPLFGSFEEAEEAKVARIDGASVIEAAVKLGQSTEVDGVFLSCTNLRTLDVIGPIEARLGMPVLSSNLVLAWHMAKLAGLALNAPEHGRLFAA